jgi:hypothetical protein
VKETTVRGLGKKIKWTKDFHKTCMRNPPCRMCPSSIFTMRCVVNKIQFSCDGNGGGGWVSNDMLCACASKCICVCVHMCACALSIYLSVIVNNECSCASYRFIRYKDGRWWPVVVTIYHTLAGHQLWCYSGVTFMLQWWYSVTVVLQWCWSGVTVVLLPAKYLLYEASHSHHKRKTLHSIRVTHFTS